MSNDNDFASTRPPLSALGVQALTYSQEYGWPVFPVEPRGKKPLIAGGFRMASQHPEQVCAWWDQWPLANIGFCPGMAGLVVLDIDGPAGKAAARDMHVFAADTLEVATSRGVHKYFRLPDGVTLGNESPWPELDVRAHAGYVLLPPSVHPSGHVYTWRGQVE
jgi:Bifunctional DNA primase/polymerase, N-terminal.